jgi:hypothetical protein
MHSLRLFFFLIIFLTGIIVFQAIVHKTQNTSGAKRETVNTNDRRTSWSAPSPTTASPDASDLAAQGKKSSDQSDTTFQYPHSLQITDSTYESTDDPSVITEWYKEKIVDAGLRTKTFVQTRANGTIENKLVGANADESVTVSIRKKPDNAAVTIEVSKT